MQNPLAGVEPIDEEGNLTVLVETPKGSRHKYDYDAASGLMRLNLQLPEGMSFPFAFGFMPNTLAEDGDALDVALLIDGTVPGGTLVACRAIGLLTFRQEESDGMARNDRIVAVPALGRVWGTVGDVGDLGDSFEWDLCEFFRTYNNMIGRSHEVLGLEGAEAAARKVEAAVAKAAR